MFRYRNSIKQLNDCHVIIVLGGDDISKYYGILKLLDMLFRLRHLKRAGKKIWLLGQSIGPFFSWRVPLAKNILGKIDKIYHRGSRSYNYVANVLGVKHNSFFLLIWLSSICLARMKHLTLRSIIYNTKDILHLSLLDFGLDIQIITKHTLKG